MLTEVVPASSPRIGSLRRGVGVGGLSDTGEDEGEEEAEDRSAAGLPVPASFSCGGGGDGAASTCCLLPGVGVGDSVTRAVTRKVRNVLGTLSDRERCFSRAVAGCWGGAGAGSLPRAPTVQGALEGVLEQTCERCLTM